MQTRDMLTKERFLIIGIFFLATCLKEVLSQNTIEAGTYAAGTCPPEYATAEVLFCNGACGDDWGDDVSGCQQADADAYCKLKNCDENGFATAFVIDQISRTDDPMIPGFGCMYGKEKLDVDFDKYEGTWFGIVDVHFSTGTAETHGGGQIIRDVVCAETCSDGIQNQDETDIDCGGTICELCVSPISVEWTGATYSQCYVNAQQYSDDRKDNPIFGGGGFVGTMSLDACKEYCVSGVTDSYGRPCAAIEFSSIDENVEASCALAWGCDYLEYWNGGSVYYLGSLPGVLDVCDDTLTDVLYENNCYYLDGSGGSCVSGSLASQDILSEIAPQFIGKTYKTVQSTNCCIWHLLISDDQQDWGMVSPSCNTAGPFASAPELGGSSCTNANSQDSAQLTLCSYPLA